MTKDIVPTKRTQVRRVPKNAVYNKGEIYSILDSGMLCHIGFAVEEQTYVIPTIYVRVDDHIYFHGSSASRMMRNLARGLTMCLTVTHTDGLVLARSAYNHSLNYRSVVAIGTASVVTDRAELLHALQRLTDHIVPDRWAEVRQPNELELKATCLMSLELTEVSAKVRRGPPLDDEADYALPVWAGEVELHWELGPLVPDERLDGSVPAFSLDRFRPHEP